MEDNNSEEENNQPDPPTKKAKQARKIYQKYNLLWEKDNNYKSWIAASKKGLFHAYCKSCDDHITIKSGKWQLDRHMQTSKHLTICNRMKKQFRLNEMPAVKQENKLAVQVKDGEIRLAAFIAEHDLSMRTADHLPQIIKTVASDSEIAKKITLDRTKASAIIKNVTGKESKKMLVEEMKNKFFSIIVDETIDKACQKQLCIIVRLCNDQFYVKDCFFYMIPVFDATSDNLFATIVSSMDRENIPWRQNIIGFAADGASNMMGKHNSVATRLKQEIPNLFVWKCICHSFNLCASYACAKLPRHVEDLARDIYNYFQYSAKRIQLLAEFQEFVGAECHKILHICNTRWLSLEMVVNRLLEQWDALKLFFTDAVTHDRLLSSGKILEAMNEATTKLFLEFLSFVLPIFNNLNRTMQSEESQIHKVVGQIKTVLKTILGFYMNAEYLDSHPLQQIEYDNPRRFLPLEKMYFGAHAAVKFHKENHGIPEAAIHVFRLRCLDFYIESVKQILQRVSISDPTLQDLTFLEPKNVKQITTIAPLASNFPNIVSESELQKLDTEWRTLKNVEEINFNKSSATQFWIKVGKLTFGDSQPMFPILIKFVFALLSFPHASANVERIFSIMNGIKTKKRSKIGNKLMNGLLHTKRFFASSDCFSFPITKEMRDHFTVDMYCQYDSDDVI